MEEYTQLSPTQFSQSQTDPQIHENKNLLLHITAILLHITVCYAITVSSHLMNTHVFFSVHLHIHSLTIE